MSKPVVIIGGGGHGRVLIDALLILGADIMGVADPQLRPEDAPFNVPLLGGDEAIMALSREDVLLVNGVGSIKSTLARDAVYQRFLDLGFRFASVVHPSAMVSPRAIVEVGCQIMAGAVVQCDAQIGVNSIINTRSSVDHGCSIGRSVHIAPGVVLCADVRIGEGSHVGSGAVIIQGIEIASRSLIPAGSVVTSKLDKNEKMKT